MLMKSAVQPLRILLVEDNEDVVALFVGVLEALGYTVKSVKSGAQALSVVLSYIPDVVFTSIQTGTVSGYDLSAYLRKRPEMANALIVAVTGAGGLSQNEAKAAGFDYYLMKPVELEKLLETMQHLEGYRGNTVPPLSFPNNYRERLTKPLACFGSKTSYVGPTVAIGQSEQPRACERYGSVKIRVRRALP